MRNCNSKSNNKSNLENEIRLHTYNGGENELLPHSKKYLMEEIFVY